MDVVLLCALLFKFRCEAHSKHKTAPVTPFYSKTVQCSQCRLFLCTRKTLNQVHTIFSLGTCSWHESQQFAQEWACKRENKTRDFMTESFRRADATPDMLPWHAVHSLSGAVSSTLIEKWQSADILVLLDSVHISQQLLLHVPVLDVYKHDIQTAKMRHCAQWCCVLWKIAWSSQAKIETGRGNLPNSLSAQPSSTNCLMNIRHNF